VERGGPKAFDQHAKRPYLDSGLYFMVFDARFADREHDSRVSRDSEIETLCNTFPIGLFVLHHMCSWLDKDHGPRIPRTGHGACFQRWPGWN